jgi:SH3-like domain-containing protein
MARQPGVRAVASALVVAIGFAWSVEALAANGGEAPSAFPRFASLRADKVNMRAGPADRFPVQWVYQRKEWPVELIGYWEHFWRIRDWEGTEGWVRETLITNKRGVIISGGVRGIRQSPDPGAPLLARAEPGVMGHLLECRTGWCRIEAGDITGWIERSNIWGIYPTETVP